MADIYLTDSHAHLNFDSYDEDRESVLSRAREAGVSAIINIGLGPDEGKFEAAYSLASSNPGVFLALGVHPHDADKMSDDDVKIVKKHAQKKGVCAVGEIGLDFYYNNASQEAQKKRFADQLDLALELGLPVSIHSRDAADDTLRITKDRKIFERVGGVLHCFTGTRDEALRFLDLGACISFSGIITFKKAETLRDVVRAVPLEKMLIETDSPYLAPEPYRGKRNEPAYVKRVAETVAGVKGCSWEDVAKNTSATAKNLFRLRFS